MGAQNRGESTGLALADWSLRACVLTPVMASEGTGVESVGSNVSCSLPQGGGRLLEQGRSVWGIFVAAYQWEPETTLERS